MEENERHEVILSALKPFERMLREHVAQRQAEAAAVESSARARKHAYIRASEGGEIQAKVRALMIHLLQKEGML